MPTALSQYFVIPKCQGQHSKHHLPLLPPHTHTAQPTTSTTVCRVPPTIGHQYTQYYPPLLIQKKQCPTRHSYIITNGQSPPPSTSYIATHSSAPNLSSIHNLNSYVSIHSHVLFLQWPSSTLYQDFKLSPAVILTIHSPSQHFRDPSWH